MVYIRTGSIILVISAFIGIPKSIFETRALGVIFVALKLKKLYAIIGRFVGDFK